jgi:tetratricopeptide (TPR) repeat protein
MTSRLYSVTVIFICLFISVPVQAQQPDIYLDFAEHLFKQADYYRAITEAKRFLYLHPDDPRQADAHMLIARSYYEAGQYENARESYLRVIAQSDRLDLAAEAVMELGRTMERLDPQKEAPDYYRSMIAEPNLPFENAEQLKNAARYRLGWLHLDSGHWRDAEKTFTAIGLDDPLKNSADQLARLALEGESLPSKSPQAAGLMSALLPGAGQLYVGRYTDAAIAFCLNAAFLWGTVEAYQSESWAVFGLLGLFETAWYGGNIYNAVNGAHIHNREVREDFLKKVKQQHGWRLGYSPKHDGAMISWSFDF